MELFLLPFLFSFILAAIFLFVLSSQKIFANPRKSGRHVGARDISRLGGVAVIASFLIAILVDKNLVVQAPLWGILISSAAILFFGLIDDFKEVSWKKQLAFQVLLVVFIYLAGVRLEYISNPFGGLINFDGLLMRVAGFLLMGAWVLLIMNAINWIDGIDGASAGVSSIAALSIFFLSLRPEVDQPPMGIITAAFFGSIFAFLLFNFHPAKIFAGTSGSMFMGFILAVMAVFAGAKIATTLLVLAIPVIDAGLVILERLRQKRSIFLPDRKHLHFRLFEAGWSQKKICFFYYIVTAIIAIVALNTRIAGKMATLAVFAFVLISISFIIKSRLKSENI